MVNLVPHQRCLHALDKILRKLKTYYESQDPNISFEYYYDTKRLFNNNLHHLWSGYPIFNIDIEAREPDYSGMQCGRYVIGLKRNDIQEFLQELSYVDSMIQARCNYRTSAPRVAYYLGIAESSRSIADFLTEELYPEENKTTPPEKD